jgi:hypothetical protein
MTEHTVRLYAAVVGLVVFFLFWAAVAAKPWAATGESDPRAAAIERREEKLARETRRVNRVVQRRFTIYRKQLARRKRAIARREQLNAAVAAARPGAATAAPVSGGSVAAAPSAPSVSVTPAAPVTTTSSS